MNLFMLPFSFLLLNVMSPFSWTPHYFICAFLTDYAKLKTSDQIVFLHEFSALYQTFGKVS